ncbi:hypothetical protein [Helicobacter cholecystus]|uniref:hypothetical protein n=1 Tax=Helicobacter cholecystus TaxID=45498 RepID=UPI0027384126|nr:hypothetical protein [Helicobacter cholecystus]
MRDPVWEKLYQINALKSLWEDVVKLPMIGIDLRNEILHITFAHIGYLQEWRMGEEMYMNSLREEYKKRGLRKVVVFRKIKCKVKFKRIEKTQEQKQEQYTEKSIGEFKNHCTNQRLFEAFERIRETIRSKNDREAKNLS